MNPSNTINATGGTVSFFERDGAEITFPRGEHKAKFVMTARKHTVNVPSDFKHEHIVAPAITSVEGLPFVRDPNMYLIVDSEIGEYLARHENSHIWIGPVVGLDRTDVGYNFSGNSAMTSRWVVYRGVSLMHN